MLRKEGGGDGGGWIFQAGWKIQARKERKGKERQLPARWSLLNPRGGGGEAFRGRGRKEEEKRRESEREREADLGRRDEDYRGWREGMACALDGVVRRAG